MDDEEVILDSTMVTTALASWSEEEDEAPASVVEPSAPWPVLDDIDLLIAGINEEEVEEPTSIADIDLATFRQMAGL